MADTIHKFELRESGQRLDKTLAELLPDISRAQIQRLIAEGLVSLDGKSTARAGLKLKGGEVALVRVPPPTPTQVAPEPIPLCVIYEDEDVIVVDKPAGMVVHPSAGHPSGTLVNAILAYNPDIEGVGGETRPGIVHRLDKDTSGIIMVAKNDRIHRFVQEQFKARTVAKSYLALVIGSPPTPTGRVEAYIGRDMRQRQRMAVFDGERGRAREAISEYLTIESFEGFTLLDVKPLTGRTHQVRVHMSFLGCPIVGDRLYGRRCVLSRKLRRHFLHAQRLSIIFPDGRRRMFSSDTPLELETVLRELRTG